jgi:hypothetical protein
MLKPLPLNLDGQFLLIPPAVTQRTRVRRGKVRPIFLEERSAKFALARIDLGKKAQEFLKYLAAKSRNTTSMKR